MADKPAPKNAKEIEAELQASRQRLASTIDELAFRAQPKEVAKRQVESVKLKANDLTRSSDGEVAGEKVGAIVGGAGVALLLLGLLRRARG